MHTSDDLGLPTSTSDDALQTPQYPLPLFGDFVLRG